MRYSHVAVALVALGWTASSAWAQFGLSGAPELVRLPANSLGFQQPVYPSTSAPAVVAMDPAMRPVPLPPTSTAMNINASFFRPQGQMAVPGSTTPPPTAFPPPASLPPPTTLPPPTVLPTPSPTLTPPPPPPSQYPPLQGPGLVGQMLGESGCANGNCWSGYGNGGACAPGSACAMPSCDFAPAASQPAWYTSVAGLVMGRNEANRVWTTYRTDHNAEQLLHTQEARAGWQGGYEVTIGRMFACNRWAVEVSYWWLAEMSGFAEVPNRDYTFAPGGYSYSTPLSFDNVVWANAGIPGTPSDIFNFARQYRIWRWDNFQNLELNLIRHQIAADCAGGVSVDWSVGVRYFRFDEQLRVGALRQNVPPEPTYSWGSGGGVCEAYLEDTIHNALVGFQFGLNAVYPVHPAFRFFVTPKLGIYNNHIEHRFAGYRGDGEPIAPSAGSGVSGSFPVSGSTDAVSFLSEINVGLDWCFAPRWNAFAGYRVIWASGIGLAENQFLPYVIDIPGHRHVEHNGDLVLHGAFAGVTYCF